MQTRHQQPMGEDGWEKEEEDIVAVNLMLLLYKC